MGVRAHREALRTGVTNKSPLKMLSKTHTHKPRGSGQDKTRSIKYCMYTLSSVSVRTYTARALEPRQNTPPHVLSHAVVAVAYTPFATVARDDISIPYKTAKTLTLTHTAGHTRYDGNACSPAGIHLHLVLQQAYTCSLSRHQAFTCVNPGGSG